MRCSASSARSAPTSRREPSPPRGPVEAFRYARCGTSAAPHATCDAHVPEARITIARGPRHPRLHHIGRSDHASTNPLPSRPVPTWLIIVIVVLIVLAAGGILARSQQLKRSRPAFERNLAEVEHDLVAAAAADRGWNREHLEAAARRIGSEHLGAEPEELTLVEVLDLPGTDEDQAVFDVRAAGKRHRLVLGRRDGDWVLAERS